MSEAVVAKRYADDLFQLSNKKNNFDTVNEQLKVVQEVFNNDKQITKFLSHPCIAKGEKLHLVENVFGQFEQNVKNFLKLLVERNRIDVVSAIIDNFYGFYNEANKIAAATVYSVRELSEEEQNKLEASFKEQLNKESVSINNIVDPSILGGMRIRVGNTIYDGSISNKLNRLKQNIVSASK